MQRLIDITGSLAGIAVLLPVLAIIALAVKLSDGGKVLFSADRVGKGGRLFRLHKFRTMVPNAHTLGSGITAAKDPRITPLGAFLRKFKLDELPQLFNVLKGDMSFVGARPEDPRYVALYNSEQREILGYRPGITSPASLHYRNEEAVLSGKDWHTMYVSEVLPRKLDMDLRYLRQRSTISDLVILLRTMGALLR